MVGIPGSGRVKSSARAGSRRLLVAGLAIGMACAGGGPDETGPEDLTVTLAEPEFGYQFRSEPHMVPAGEEVYTCDVVRIEPHDDEDLVWLGAFESKTSLHTHHMNVNVGLFSVWDYIFGEGASTEMLEHDLGQYDCGELGDLMEEQGAQTIYPSQRAHQKGEFPRGVGLPAVVPLVLVMEHHYINTTGEDVLVDAAVNFHRVPADEVEHVLTGFAGGIGGIDLPPESAKIEAATCELTRPIELLAISSHSHERGECFTMNFYDGEQGEIEPEPFFVNKDWESPPIMFMEQQEWTDFEPVRLEAGDGIHWACHYVNPEDRAVTNGAGADDEMCIFVGVGYPSALTVGDVERAAADPLGAGEELAEKATIPCRAVTDATSPWSDANEAIPLAEEPVNACGAYSETRAAKQ